MTCKPHEHYYYYSVPQHVVINGCLRKYYACECGQSVDFDGVIMTMEEFINATQKTD